MNSGAPGCCYTTILCRIRSYMYSKDVFDVLPVIIRAPCYAIDDPHWDLVGAPAAPKDDAMACMASSLNTPLFQGSKAVTKGSSAVKGQEGNG